MTQGRDALAATWQGMWFVTWECWEMSCPHPWRCHPPSAPEQAVPKEVQNHVTTYIIQVIVVRE